MMKRIILVLLLAASLSAAKPPIPQPDLGQPHGHVFIMSSCTYNQLSYLLSEGGSYFMDDGKDCVNPDLAAQRDAVFEQFYGDGSPGLVDLYWEVLWACEDGEGGQECSGAKSAFYSAARSARSAFSSAKAAYYAAGMQSVHSYETTGGKCGNPRSDITYDVQASAATWRQCMFDPR